MRTTYDEDDLARKTIKETLIQPSALTNLRLEVKKGGASAYNPDDWQMRKTMKEANLLEKYPNSKRSVLSGRPRSTTHLQDTARTTLNQLSVEKTREGFLVGQSKATVYDPDDTPQPTVKETTLYTHEGNIDSRQNNDAYLVSKYEAKKYQPPVHG